jgi:hypothetical protein
MPKPAPKSDAREELASAIEARERARKAVSDAQLAEEKSREHLYAARARVRELQAEASTPRSADDLVAAIAGEGHVDILEMDKPAAEVLAALQVAERQVEAWRRACALAEQQVPIRQDALGRCEAKAKERANAALADAINVGELLAEAEQGAATIVALRAKLLFVSSILPRDDSRRAGIAEFLGRAWLQTEYDDGWRKNPTVAPLMSALAALQRDAEATIAP